MLTFLGLLMSVCMLLSGNEALHAASIFSQFLQAV